jgi:hypothetical protein
MKTTLKHLMLVLAICSAQQSHAVFFDWVRSYDGGNVDKGLHVFTDALGNSYLTGAAELPGGSKIISSAYADDGTLLWQRTANTFLPGTVKQVERDDALNTYVLCENAPASFTLIRYNSNAIEKWRRNYANLVIKFKVGNPAAVYVCGQTDAGVVMQRLNKNTGSTTWMHSFADANLSTGLNDFTIDASSNLYYCGTTTSTEFGDDDYKMIKLNKNGVVIYNIQYDAGSDADEETYNIAANDAGELFIVGDYDNDILARTYYHLVKFNAAGAHQWHTYFESSVADVYFPMEVQVGPDGNPVVVGTDNDYYNINPAGRTDRIEVTKFNAASGAIIFTAFPSDPDLTNMDILEESRCMTIDADNDIYVGGTSNTSAGIDHDPDRWLVIKVNGATGLEEWAEAGVLFDAANEIADVAVTAAFDVFLAGTENLSGNPDMHLTKYCQVGCFSPRLGTPGASGTSVVVYPNPSASAFLLTSENDAELFTLSVFDLTGKLVEEHERAGASLQFGENLAPGSYILKYFSASENKTMRIVKTH